MRVYLKDYLADELERRYALIHGREAGKMYSIIDGDFPRILRKELKSLGNESLPSSALAISESIADHLGIQQVPFEDLITMLGYNKKKLNDLVIKVKRKKLDFVFVGFGGVGMNTNYWLGKILELVSKTKLFHKVYVYDNDAVDFSNTLRFPQRLTMRNVQYDTLRKAQFYNNYKELSYTKPEINTRKLNANDLGSWSDAPGHTKNVIYYGAPDLTTRNLFKAVEPDPDAASWDTAARKGRPAARFIMATHGDNSCSLMTNPDINTDLQVESYGMIRLNIFFMNQIRMAIGLLEVLASNDETIWDTPTTMLDFNFEQCAIDTRCIEESKYNMKITHSGTMGSVE